MIVKAGQTVRTTCCYGIVRELIDGRERGWQPIPYLRLEVTRPGYAAGTTQIVKLSEVRDIV